MSGKTLSLSQSMLHRLKIFVGLRKLRKIQKNHQALNLIQTSSKKQIPQELIEQLSSDYLQQGIFQDDFTIKSLHQKGPHFEASIALTKFGISVEDVGGYHLTAPSLFRMAGQSMIIHIQQLFGFEEKKMEVWVREHYMKHRWPFRDPQHISLVAKMCGWKVAHSNPDIIGVRFEMEAASGAVSGETTSFFDLSPLKEKEVYKRQFSQLMKSFEIPAHFDSIRKG